MISLANVRKPKHLSIQETIASNIAQGKWRKGDLIPSVRELGQTCGASALTARKAVEALISKGILVGKQGVGTFVSSGAALQHVGVVLGAGSEAEELRKTDRFMGLIEDSCRMWAETHLVRTTTYVYLDDEHVNGSESGFWRDVLAGRLDGVIAIQLPRGNLAHDLVRWKVPVVAIGGNPLIPYRVDGDWRALVFRAVQLSLEAGRQRLAFFSRTPTPAESGRDHIFLKDLFIAACHEYGVRAEASLIKTADKKTVETGYSLAKELLDQRDQPDGLVIPDDVMARGVLRALQERGVRVPEQMTVVTHSNRGAMPFEFPVSLTRLEVDPAAMIAEAAEMLTHLMRGEGLPECVRRCEPKLMSGQSCPVHQAPAGSGPSGT